MVESVGPDKDDSHKASVSQPDRLAEPADSDIAPRLPFPVVALGGSAGGLEAFTDFFKAMPRDSGMAFVLIQHLPPERESMMVEILSKRTEMPVQEVKEGLAVKPNHVYVIRPGHKMTIRNGVLHLGEPVEMPVNRRPVDDFFRSLAEEQHQRAICIIMSGMGSNGTAGAAAIKVVGGLCIAQDPETAKFPVMPRSLIDSGLADFILRPADMPDVLIRYATHPYTRGAHSAEDVAHAERQVINEILAILRARTRHDFKGYKKPTLVRRIERRMGLNQITKMSEYTRVLRQNPAEVAALSDDLMIHVTGFFRDPEVWDTLRRRVIIPLVAERTDDTPIRAWVTACSSGEEAYTLGMLILEAAEAAGKHFDIKVFATDTASRSLSQARTGTFPGGIESEIAPQRLERFFDKDESTYRVKKELRELVVFAPQNVLQDPPFSRLDICTCRNLLIYLEPDMQRRVLSLLHFGLREGGALLLGNTESISGVEDMFEPIDKKTRLFRRVGPTRHGSVEFPLPHALQTPTDLDRSEYGSLSRMSMAQIVSRNLLERFSPAAVVVDRQQHIVYFHGKTDRFLDQPRGEPTRELMTLLREPVRGAVRTALHKAMTQNEAVSVRNGVIETPEGRRRLEVTVAPLDLGPTSLFYLISFTEHDEPAPAPATPGHEHPEDRRRLEDDLRRARDELQSTIEELQTGNEEMKASNEEVTSINEELQSTNEELETSKEELQSLNEELTTVNAQLNAKMEELEAATNDMSSLLSSTDIAVLFLDTNFRIRRFTPAVKDLMDLIVSDIGRPLNDLSRKFEDPDLLNDARTVLNKLVPVEKQITSESGRVYVRRVLPYRTADNRIDGVVITFVDITERDRAEIALRQSEEQHRLILQGVTEYAIFVLDLEGRISNWPPGAERAFGYAPAEVIGKPFAMLFTAPDRAARVAVQQLETARSTGSAVVADHWHLRKDGVQFWASGVLSALKDDRGVLRGFVKVLRDNTERKHMEDSLKQAKRAAELASEAKDQFLANVSHELRTPLSAMLLWAHLLEGIDSRDPDQFREGLEAIKQSAAAQKELIEDLLDTARIAAGKLRLELKDISIVEVIRSAVAAIQPAVDSKNIELRQELDENAGIVHLDSHRIQQVIWNLLSNAVKFTPAGGRITVGLRYQDQALEIRIADTGRGIGREFLPRIFDRFEQAEQATIHGNSGLGLGLTISRQLVELHGGTLTAESDGIDRGATFTVRLPISRPTAKSQILASTPVGPDGLRGLSILVVEDDAGTRKALSVALSGAGAEVTAADSTAAALAEFHRRRPDLIVSDIGMPGEDGHAFIRKVREFEASQHIIAVPAIALTAFVREENRRKSLESGFQRHINKPVDPAELIAVISSLRPS